VSLELPVRHAFARRDVGLVAVAIAIVLISFSARYGYHRDELYFIASGHHLAWGYPDQPPFVPALARLLTAIAPHSLVLLRLPSAVATAATVVLTGLLARELDGDRRAQVLAAVAIAVCNFATGSGHLLSTSTFLMPASATIVLLSLRAVRTGDDRLWLAVGVVLGLGLFDSDLPIFLVAGLVVGVVVCGPRRIFRSPWLYAGAVIALVCWTPTLVWQAHHAWPELKVARSIAAGNSGTSAPRWAFVPQQILLVGFFFTPMYVAGLWRLARHETYRWCRPVAVAYLVMTVVFLVEDGKPYYIAGIFPVALAAGAPWFLQWCDLRPSRRRLPIWATGLSLVGLLITLPILPMAEVHDTPIVAANYDAGETIGWPTFVAEIAGVYQSVPAIERAHAIVLGSNYGETGAVDRYGSADGLPSAYGVHNATWLWGPPPPSATLVVAIGFDRDRLTPYFGSVRLATKLNNHLDVDNDEQGAPVWMCSGLKASWSATWPKLRVYG
jgi:4-amino-4-deoxy-L-arabinose transferase-like glycosyltransferase